MYPRGNFVGTDDGRRMTDDGRRTTDDGRRTTDDGRRTTDDGRRTTDDGRRTTDDGRRTTDNGANGRQREIFIFYLDEVCASFILVLVVQIVRTKKPRKASINIEAK